VNGTIYYSPMMRVIFGLPDDQVLTPEEIRRTRSPRRPFAHYREASSIISKGVTPRFVCEYRYRAGATPGNWARQSGIAQRGPDGQAIRMAGATVDITETKQRERNSTRARRDRGDARDHGHRAGQHE